MKKLFLCFACAWCMGIAPSHAAVIISEVFYNLIGTESGLTEWVEVTNTGAAAVDLTGWVYGDSQDASFSDPLPAGSVLAAGASAVIVAQSAADFQTTWGAGVPVINYTTLAGTGISLANSPSATNETVAIFDAANSLIDAVNFEAATNGWPAAANGASIYLRPGFYTAEANDVGANWAISAPGVDGAYTALAVNPGIANTTLLDVASPGVAVTAAVPEPASLAGLAAGLAALIAGRRFRR